MCKAAACARLTLQRKRVKTEIMKPGGGKSLKCRIVHGMFTAIASPAQTYLYKEKKCFLKLNLHDDILSTLRALPLTIETSLHLFFAAFIIIEKRINIFMIRIVLYSE